MENLREKKKKARRKRIFSAAVQLLKKEGFSKTSMNDIAARANLAVGTLYNYFASKNDLILAIFDHENENFIKKITNKIEKNLKSEMDAKEILIDIVYEFLQDIIFFGKQTMREVMTAFFSSEEYIEKGMRQDLQLIALLKNCIASLQKEKRINTKIDASLTSEIIYGIVFEQVLMYCMIPDFKKEKLKQHTKKQIEIIFEGLQV